MGLFSKVFGDSSSRYIKTVAALVPRINSFEAGLETKSDDELKAASDILRERAVQGEALDELLPEAFALVREAGKRTLGQRHFDVQLLGGIILHKGAISEMRTGEGKTLVATLPAYLNALTGKGVHIVTVNDYLSRRDAAWMGQIYAALGLSVAVINHDSSYLYDASIRGEADKIRDESGSYKVVYDFLRPCSRKDAYLADITYGTNSEFGFDYLRDNIAYSQEQVVNRRNKDGSPAYAYAIVDEVDSVLIDEARTPLIISAPFGESGDFYNSFARIADALETGVHYSIDEKFRAIQITDAGIDKAEEMLGVSDIYTEKGIKYVHHLETAIRAKALFRRDKEYVAKDNEIIIVDPSTGRLQPGRRWSEGLHQAIEAKEGVQIQQESRTFATITYQNFFRLYGKLSGMTGTALTSQEEFFKVYNLEVVAVPTNKPSRRTDRNDFIFQTEHGKFMAVARRVREEHDKGRPVLVGTASIEKNEELGDHFRREGVPHEILNAKNHEREGEIIANAGRRGAVTIATNMAGRGVDIKLGGAQASVEETDSVRSLGGLFVLGTERHEARRIDNQLRGRCARQGDPGETQFFVSLEDDLMRVFAADTVKKMMGRFGIPEDEPIENRIVTRSIESAQEKIEGFNFDSRKHILEYDDVLSTQRETIYKRRYHVLFGDRAMLEEVLNEMVSRAEDPAPHETVIKEKKLALGEQQFFDVLRRLLLQVQDMLWVEHLETMEYLRSSVRLRAYGQRDPLVEYKREGLRMFRELEMNLAAEILKMLPHIQGTAPKEETVELREVQESAQLIGNKAEPATSNQEPGTSDPRGKDLGRNDPCWCNSGKKYKKCHGG